jgi:hypothetical protein
MKNNTATWLDIPRYLQHFQPFGKDKQYTQKAAAFFLHVLLAHAEWFEVSQRLWKNKKVVMPLPFISSNLT